MNYDTQTGKSYFDEDYYRECNRSVEEMTRKGWKIDGEMNGCETKLFPPEKHIERMKKSIRLEKAWDVERIYG